MFYELDKMKVALVLFSSFMGHLLFSIKAVHGQQLSTKRPVYTKVLQPMHVSCPKDHAMTRISSFYVSKYRDRRFFFSCRLVKPLTNVCIWTELLHGYNQDLKYLCPSDNLITGFRSYYDGYNGDRRWSVRCCSLKCGIKLFCKLSRKMNSFQSLINYRTGCGYYIRGIVSKFDKKSRDREWRVVSCRMH